MTRNRRLAAFTNLFWALPLILSAQNPDQTPGPAVMQAVAAAFPAGLRFSPAPPSGEGSSVQPYHSCATVFSKRPDGTPDLVAAGYGGDGAEVAMLAYKPGAAQVIAAVTGQQLWLTDGDCQIAMMNLADPAQPASPLANVVDISFAGPDWFFVWDGKKLKNITALESEAYAARHDRPRSSTMYFAHVVDIDHSGPMQIAGSNTNADKFPQGDGISSSGTLTLFRFNGTTYAPAETLLLLQEFEPQPPNWDESMNGPWVDSDSIDMHHAPAPTCHLKIVNGDRNGSNRVNSAKVEINGVTVVLPTDVNPGVETFTQTVQLQKQNEIKVTVQGPQKSHIYVTVR
ncbi:MAG: hypothetical protein WBG54_05815 [Acidobacteriaceae bacterium]